MADKLEIGVYNEWGKLKEVMVAVEDDTTEMDYMPEMDWLGEESVNIIKEKAGKKTIDIFPENVKLIREQIEGHVSLLKNFGIKVHRSKPMQYQEEKNFLCETQRGTMVFGSADFFRIIGKKVILINNLRYPFRRKQIYNVRPVLEELLKNSDAEQYVSLPPASPHYTSDDMYLENGDILVDGFNIYVGCSGKATSEKGIWWLQQYLGKEYKVHMIKLDPRVFHLDGVCSLPRQGLLIYPPKLMPELPKPLQSWDKIELREDEYFGGNGLPIDDKTIIMPKGYERVCEELRKKGFEVIEEELNMTMTYGSGPHCLTAVLRRDA